MNDTYQPIFDAVRSRISNGDIGQAVYDAATRAFDISNSVDIIRGDIFAAVYEYQRPSVVRKVTITLDGNMWCCLLGSNLQTGVSGWGKSPEDACVAFDRAWHNKIVDAPPAPTTQEIEG